MPLDHSRATAKVSVTGLALGCLNRATRNWEVALIRAPGHDLRITVTKKAADGTSSKFTFGVDANHRILITAANAVVPAEPLYMREPFCRLKPEQSDSEDVRFLVDFEREFNDNKPLPIVPPNGDTKVTEMFVSQPVLYADPDKIRKGMQLVNLATNEQKLFGTLSEICNADIECNEGGVVIFQVQGPLGFSIDLPRIAGVTHTIQIDNSCPPGLVESGQPTDFNHYFTVVRLPGGVTFDLRTEGSDFGSDAVCNGSMVNSRDSLLPLGGA